MELCIFANICLASQVAMQRHQLEVRKNISLRYNNHMNMSYEIERKRQLTGNAEDTIKQLQKLGFELQSSDHEIDTYYSRPMLISCRRLNVCEFASVMVLLR